MHRFFSEQVDLEAHKIRITGSDVNHLKNVLRLKEGDEVEVSDGQSLHRCAVRSFENGAVTVEILETLEEDRELSAKIVLFQGLPKGDKMDLIVQKAVELGASVIVPFDASRSVVRLSPEKAVQRTKRYRTIAENAAKQSGRSVVPKVETVMSFAEAVKSAAEADVFLLPYECETDSDATADILDEIKPGMTVSVMIGPEGGFDPPEVVNAKEAGARIVTLGKRILRTETAGLAALSMLVYLLEIRK